MIYTQVIPHVSGVDVNQAMIRLAMGEPAALAPNTIRRAANIEFMQMPLGTLHRIIGVDEAAAIPGVAVVHFNVAVGEEIEPLGHKDHRPGYVVALADTTKQAIETSLLAKSRISVLVGDAIQPTPVY